MKYRVHLPVSIDLVVEVEADSEDEAIDKGFQVDRSLNPKGAEIDACEAVKQLTTGNVVHAVLNEAYAEET